MKRAAKDRGSQRCNSMSGTNASRGFFDRALRGAGNDSKHVRFKDRGADVSEWRGNGPQLEDSGKQWLEELQTAGLAIVENAPLENDRIRPNPTGLKKGYDPYDSGRLAKTTAARRRDLRRLGEWLKLCKRANHHKPS